MPSNRSPNQTIQVKMKQHPSKKKTSTKATSGDSVSETISFVIKGKLTPIKPTFVARRVGVGKKVLKLDKKLKTSVSRKKPVSIKNSKIVLCADKAENDEVTSRSVNTPKKVRKKKQPKNISESRNEVSIQESSNKIVKRKLMRNVKKIVLVDENIKVKNPPGKQKISSNPPMSETLRNRAKQNNAETKLNSEDIKKQKTIAKLLKQANKVLEKQKKPIKNKTDTKTVVKLKPKNQKAKVAKKKNLVKKKVNKIQKQSNSSDEEIKKVKQSSLEIQTDPSYTAVNNFTREDSNTSDDNNLEQIRQSLKRENPQLKKKSKLESICDNDTKVASKETGSVKKAEVTQTKRIPNKIKKARLEDHKLRKLKLYGFWNRPKRQRVASLNAIAKVHCLYENEGRISMLDNPEIIPIKKEVIPIKKEIIPIKKEIISIKKEIVEKSDKSDEEKTKKERISPPPQRSLRYVPGLRGVGKHWDMHNASSSSSDEYSDDAEVFVKKIVKVKKETQKKVEEEKSQKKRKRKQTEIVMDLKDMVVSKRMASLNATAILAASYSQEKRSAKSPKGEASDYTDSSDDDLMSDEDQKSCYENDVKKEDKLIEVRTKPNKKVAVILNQDTDVTITGVYVNSTTRSTHHEGYCSIAGMQYRISATSHTQTAATAVATETLLQSSTTSSTQENTNSETLTPTGKSYKPLDALSNMRPPSDGAHHAHQSMGPPQHVMSLSPSGIRHGCSSAFTAPHPSAYHHGGPPQHGPPPPPPNLSGEPGYIHGYYQPAGPLITVPLGHGQPPLAKSAPLSETSPTTPSPLSSHPPHPASSINGDSSDSEVIITSVTAGKDVAPPPQAHTSYRYSQYPSNVPPPSYSYPYSSHYYHPTPPPPPTYSPHDMCYSPTPYVHPKFTPTSYRRYLGAPQYYPPNPPPPTQDMYAIPPTHAQPSQQVVTTTPVSGSGAPYQPSMGPPPPSTLMEPYPPTLVETYPSHYYPGYPPGPVSTCYSHAPPPRAVSFINGAYQSCPCPMQSCPKNGLTGPLTGDSKRSNTLPKNSMPPLPPVALALPKEPTSDGPPSPARGSAGMPPPPSPAGATYQQQPTPPTKQESISPANEIPVEKRRKARVGKAMVRSNMQNTMLLMCNPIPANCVKREIESPKDKEIITVPEKEEVALNIETVASTEFKNAIPQPVEEVTPPTQPVQTETPVKIEEKHTEITKEEEPKLEPIISTVGENVKVKNMKRKLSLSLEGKEEIPASPPKKQKTEVKVNGSYKNLIKKNTSSIRINNGRRKLIQESRIPQLLSRATLINRRKAQKKRKLCSSKEFINTNKLKQLKSTNTALSTNNNKQNFKITEMESGEYSAESKENIKRGSFTQLNVKSNQKIAPILLDNLIAKNSVDRTIECVISDAIRTSVPKKVDKVKKVKEPLVPTSVGATYSTKRTCRSATNRRKSKCKDSIRVTAALPQKSLHTLRWSNGWNWEGEPYDAKVFLNSDETTVIRKCYPSMRHHSGDLIEVKDCVLLKAGARRNELPFVAKIAALWENPEDGEMMMSLLWYYRPEHTEQGRLPIDQPDEVFASRHKDSNSVACIDDKCFVLTFNEYCRYRRHLRRLEEGIEDQISPCIPLPEPYPRSHRQPPEETKISPEMVFFCRRVYDFRQKRIIKNPT